MPQHFTIANFKFGLDARRSELTSVPGTLLAAENGHINQGAQFEKRKAFVKLGTLPAECFGLQETSNGLITYGSAATPDLSVFGGLISYQRIRHPYFQLDQLAPQYLSHMNPNSVVEPALSSIVHSCSFGGFDFAIASFTAAQDNGSRLFDDYFSGTFYYYKGKVLVNCLQGRHDFANSTSIPNVQDEYLLALFCYFGTTIVGTNFTFNSLTVGNNLAASITGPSNSPFTIVVSDSCQQFTTQVQVSAAAPVTAVGAQTTIYFTKAAAGTKNISALTGPNVVNGVVSGTLNLIPATVNFNTSIYQTCLDLATAINNNSTGYTAQATFLGTALASVTITAPPSFGGVVNAANVAITTSNLFVNTVALVNSGAAGAPTNFALAGGVTRSSGSSQTSLIFPSGNSVLTSTGLGSFQCDLVFNTLTYTLGRGNLTTTRATAVFWLTSGASGSVDSILTPDGTNLLNAAVAFNVTLSGTSEAVVNSIVDKYNSLSREYRYSGGGGVRNENTWLAYPAQTMNADGATIYGVEIVAPPGELYNGVNLTINTTTIKVAATANGPTFSGTNPLTITLGSDTLAVISGSFVIGLAGKLYMARGSRFNFSSSYDCTKWERQDTGAGFIQNMDWYSSPTDIVALCPYQGKMAVFSRRNISVWQVNADPAQYAQSQSLPNIGTFAKLSVQPLGDLDVLFLSDTGVRSLRVRDNTLNAFVNDIGSPIDNFVTASLIANTATANAAACAIVEPGSGRYWLYLNGTIYVLSYYPSLKIVAWSTYLPTYSVAGVQTAFVPVKFLSYNGQVYVLDSNNNVYVYGGIDNNTYDGCVATIQSPWMDLKGPQMNKNSLRLNAAMTGEWQVQAGMDPRANDLMTVVEANPAATGSEPNDSTFDESSFAWSRYGTHFQFKATTASTWTKAALFSSITLQYNPGRDE